MKNQLFIVLLFFVAAALVACPSKSDPAPAAADCQAITKKFADAALLYSTTPTSANCKAYIAAGNEYLNKASSCGVSATVIADARKDLNATATACP
jgi:thioredoxin-like negative regulator of GroEL